MRQHSKFKICMRLIELVKPMTGYMLLAIFAGLAGHLCATFIPVLGGVALLNLLGFSAPTPSVLFPLVLVLALLRGALRYGEQACNHFIAFKLLALIRKQVFAALRKLCPAKLEGREKGNLIAVITSDIELLEMFYAHTISPIVIAVAMSIILCAVIGSYHPLLGLLAAMAYGIIGIVVPLVTSRCSAGLGSRLRAHSGALTSFVLESLHGLSETLQYCGGATRLTQIELQTKTLSSDEQAMKRLSGYGTAFTGATILLFDAGFLVLAASLYLQGLVEFDSIVVPLLLLMSSFGPFISLANLGSGLQNTFASGSRVLGILDEQPVTREISGKPKCSNFTGANVRQVSFSYCEETILSGISLEIPKAGIVGITGKSGSGKSTLLKLLMRFWSAQQGLVSVSNRSVDEIDTADLRRMQGYMTQDTHLFHDSIANNLRIAKLNATQQELETACKKAAVHNFITQLPHGYDTAVGELGGTLSGGERQRIGLARAFLHSAPLLLLDEPTSNLDSLNEAAILNAIDAERTQKAIVLVSHRASTMCVADTVFHLKQGRVS